MSHIRQKVGLVSMCLVLAACATGQPRQANVITADQSEITRIKKMTLLPVVSRIDIQKETLARLVEQTHKRVAVELANKGYVLGKAATFSNSTQHTAESLYNMEPKELAELGPSGATFLIVPYLHELDKTNLVIARSTDVTVAAILIDKSTGRVLWQDESKGSFGMSTLTGGPLVLLAFDEDIEAVVNAVTRLFNSFPPKRQELQ